MFVINLLLNKILCAAFGTLSSGLPPVWTPSHLLGQCPIFLVFFEGIPTYIVHDGHTVINRYSYGLTKQTSTRYCHLMKLVSLSDLSVTHRQNIRHLLYHTNIQSFFVPIYFEYQEIHFVVLTREI